MPSPVALNHLEGAPSYPRTRDPATRSACGWFSDESPGAPPEHLLVENERRGRASAPTVTRRRCARGRKRDSTVPTRRRPPSEAGGIVVSLEDGQMVHIEDTQMGIIVRGWVRSPRSALREVTEGAYGRPLIRAAWAGVGQEPRPG